MDEAAAFHLYSEIAFVPCDDTVMENCVDATFHCVSGGKTSLNASGVFPF
jgi:hypothetical protein